MSLRLYCGDYLTSPVPLHFGMNHCSHNCWYCYANLNRAGRRMVNDDLPRIARWYEKDKGPLEYWFMKRGFPMFVSNDTDPFAKTNCASFEALVAMQEKYGFACCWQTKTGDEYAESLALNGRKTMINVTLTSDDDKLLKEMEPGAPGYAHRLDFIGKAVKAGHFVIVNLFPFVPGWWRDMPEALRVLHDLGVRHLWVGTMHLSRFQIDAMSPGIRSKYANWIEYARKRNKQDNEAAEIIRAYANSMDFAVFDGVRSSKPRFFQPFFDLGYPFFPTINGFYDELLVRGGGRPVVFDFEVFDEWADVGAPCNLSVYRDYLHNYARSLRNAKVDMKCRSFHDVHELEWQCMDFPTRFRQRETCIAVDGEGGPLLVDDNGRNLMVFVPDGQEGQDDWFFPVQRAVPAWELT